jgi:transcriptional regulator with XRE-family HTH domain
MVRDFDQVRNALANNIRSLRSQQGISQESLALNADVDRTYVSQIERSVGNPSLLVLCKLAATLGVDAAELMASDAF